MSRTPIQKVRKICTLAAAVALALPSLARAQQAIDSEYTAQIKKDSVGSAHHDRAGRPPAGVGHRADAAQVPRPHRRRSPASSITPRTSHRYFEALAKASPRARSSGRSARRKKGATWSSLAIADEATISEPRQVQGLCSTQLDRSAQDDRSAGAAADPDGEADLLDHERHALAGVRRPRDADGAGVPPHRRGDAVHPEHPQQRHHAHHAGDRSRRPREGGRHLLLQQEACAQRAARARCR